MECDTTNVRLSSPFEDISNLQANKNWSPYSTMNIAVGLNRKIPKDVLRENIASNRYDMLKNRYSGLKIPRDFTIDRLVYEMKELDFSNKNKQKIERIIDVETELSHNLRLIEDKIELKKDFIEVTKNLLKYECLKMNILLEERYSNYDFDINCFLRSDLPSPFIREIGTSLNWEIIAINLFLTEANDLNDKIEKRNLSRREFDILVREYKRETMIVKKLADDVLTARERLDVYTDIWNCKNLNEFRRVKDLEFIKLNKNYFESLIKELQDITLLLSKNLLNNYKPILDNLKLVSEEDIFLNDFIKNELLEPEEIF